VKHRVIAGATPWRDRPFLTLQDAAEIVGCSTATLYGAAAAERLELCRLGGRTLVKTPSLVAYIATAKRWTPSPKTKQATEARKKAAADGWRS